MSWIMDILQRLPVNAVLRDKIDRLTIDNVALKRERDDLKEHLEEKQLMVQKLGDQVQQLVARVRQLETPDQLDETEVKILQFVALKWGTTAPDIAKLLHINQTKTEYHFDRLRQGYYVYSFDQNGITSYGLLEKARKYLVENDQLPDDALR